MGNMYIKGLYKLDELDGNNLENPEDLEENEKGDQILRSEFDRPLNDLNSKKAVKVNKIPQKLRTEIIIS